MKKTFTLFVLLALASILNAQQAGVTKSAAAATLDQITGNLTFGSGKTLTATTGATVNLGGATVTLPATVTGGTSSFQPLDADLTAIAALSTTATGRSLLAVSLLTNAGLGITNGAVLDTIGAKAQTGTGNLVLATSPTLVTPTLGAATGTSLSLTNISSGYALALANRGAINVGGLFIDAVGNGNGFLYLKDASGTQKASISGYDGAITGDSLTANATTALTLTGGSTGASLVLGQGTTAGAATLTATGTGTVVVATAAATRTALDISNTSTGPTKNGLRILGANATSVDSRQWSLVANDFAYGDLSIRQSSAAATDPLSGTSALYVSAARNLLIGTTTDAASLAGGLVVNGSGAGAAASSTVTGALRVTGGVGVSGAGYFGGGLNVTSTAAQAGLSVANSAANIPTIYLRQNDSATGDFTIQNKNATSGYVSFSAGGGVDGLRIYPTTGNAAVISTTSASSSTVGALTIGNGSAATNVAIGGGKIWAGSTEASTGSTSGSGIFAGGIYAGGASVFNSTASFGGVTTPYSGVAVSVKGTVANAAIYISDAAGTTPGTTSPGVFFASSVKGGYFRNASGVIQLIDESSPGAGDGAVRTSVNMTTGAATFAGAVTVGGTVIHTLSATPASASATGTVGTMSWDANYIYICTATNTWKRVAIATW